MEFKMKTYFTHIFRRFIGLLIFLAAPTLVFAQRYINVPPGDGTLNSVISADSLNRIANPTSTWYVLQRGENVIYYLSNIVNHWGPTPLQIMSSGTGSLPRIIGGLQTGGVQVNKLFVATENLTIRSVFLSGLPASGPVDQRVMELSADSITVWLDSCQIDLAWQSTVRVNNGLSVVKLTNCTVSNMCNYYPSNGRVVDNRDISMDTLIIQNCSMFRGVMQIYRGSTGSVKYAFINHNTFDEYSGPLFNFNQAGTIVFQNNLVVNCGFVGRDPLSTGNQLLSATYGADSAMIRNNCFYADTALLQSGWPADVSFDPWFDDTLNYFINLYGTGSTNIEAPVKFVKQPNDITVDPYLVSIDSIAKWYWTGNNSASQNVNPIEQVDSIQLVNFEYNNDSPAYTLGLDGEPVGALTWFGIPLLGIRQGGLGHVPSGFALMQNYPNPFNPTTTITYALASSEDVGIVIYSVLGQKIRTLFHGRQSSGSHTIVWDGLDQFGRPAASGVYIYRLEAGNRSVSKKMLLIK